MIVTARMPAETAGSSDCMASISPSRSCKPCASRRATCTWAIASPSTGQLTASEKAESASEPAAANRGSRHERQNHCAGDEGDDAHGNQNDDLERRRIDHAEDGNGHVELAPADHHLQSVKDQKRPEDEVRPQSALRAGIDFIKRIAEQRFAHRQSECACKRRQSGRDTDLGIPDGTDAGNVAKGYAGNVVARAQRRFR